MRDILILAHFTQAPNEQGNGRFHYIAGRLADNEENKVEVVTTSFSHSNKKQRVITDRELEALPYQYTMINESGYPKNVCLKRFYSHWIMSRNLKKYLEKRDKPDVIYCAVPSLDVAKVAAKYAKKNHIRFIIDIQDLWPEAFKMVFNVPLISGLVYAPMKRSADYIYRNADEIVAVSQTYVNRALQVNEKCKQGFSVYLGTDLSEFDKYKSKQKLSKEDGIIRLAYIGTLGHSYDLICIFDVLHALKQKGYDNIGFCIMGDGPLLNKFEEYSKNLNINVEFTGRLAYPEMVKKLTECDIAVNPIMHGAAQSIINKVGDYAAAGLPVISTQECEEYRKLIERYNCGYNCKNNSLEDIVNHMEDLVKNESKRLELGANNRKVAEERFDRKHTYRQILALINELPLNVN